MNLVVDTSIIVAVIANEPEKLSLIAQTQGAVLFAPRSIHFEIGNAFSAMLKRGRISIKQAHAAVAVYEKISINFLEVDLARALKLSDELSIYAYDAYIIACALYQNCPLLTLDSGLEHAAKVAGVEVLEVQNDADLP